MTAKNCEINFNNIAQKNLNSNQKESNYERAY